MHSTLQRPSPASGRANCPACGGSSGRLADATPPRRIPSRLLVEWCKPLFRKQWRRCRRECSTKVVTGRIVGLLHTFRGPCAHTISRGAREDWPQSLTSATSSYVTPGMTAHHQRKSFTTCSNLAGVKVWFSEKDVMLGSPLMREIDKGLAQSRVGIVLVTPGLFDAYKELRDRREGTIRASV